MLMTDAATAAGTRRRGQSNGATFWHTTYIGANRFYPEGGQPPAPDLLYPMAFLVEQDPGAMVVGHFHQSDQFQVFTRGAGRLGTHDVTPVTVHFTGAFSPYGPIRAAAEGLHYFTLRNGWDPGARYMPGARRDLPRPRRHREAAAGPLGSAGDAPVLGREADGLGAWHWRLEAGDSREGPDPAQGAGQFWLVLDGLLAYGERRFGARSCLFVGPDEPALAVVAGTDGLGILAMQFPAGTAMRPLDGLRVVALEHAVAGPLCTRHLADFGAEVLKIERPGEGDFARAYDGYVRGLSSFVVWLNRGKRSLTLDLKHARAGELLDRLLAAPTCWCRISRPGRRPGWGWATPRWRRAIRG